MTKTELPSVGYWAGKRPFAESGFRLNTEPEAGRILEQHKLWDAMALDVCRRYDTNYSIQWMDYYDHVASKKNSLVDYVGRVLDLGKDLFFYIGGAHEDDDAMWKDAWNRGMFETRVDGYMSFVRQFRDHPNFHVVVDGAPAFGVRSPAVYLVLTLAGKGYRTVVEGHAWRGHPLRDFPSLTIEVNAASDLTNSTRAEEFDSFADPENHGVLLNAREDIMAANVTKWRDAGHRIFVPSFFVTEAEPTPKWWNGVPA